MRLLGLVLNNRLTGLSLLILRMRMGVSLRRVLELLSIVRM